MEEKNPRSKKVGVLEYYAPKTLTQILIDLYDELGSVQAIASHLGVSQGTISNWMSECHLEVRSQLTYKLTDKGYEVLKQPEQGKTTVVCPNCFSKETAFVGYHNLAFEESGCFKCGTCNCTFDDSGNVFSDEELRRGF